MTLIFMKQQDVDSGSRMQRAGADFLFLSLAVLMTLCTISVLSGGALDKFRWLFERHNDCLPTWSLYDVSFPLRMSLTMAV